MATFEGSRQYTLKEIAESPQFQARRLDDTTSLKYDKYTPTNWHQRLPVVPSTEVVPQSGLGYVQSPYISQWTKMWGVYPLGDLSKFRMMFRTVPIVKKAVEKTVSATVAKGFKLELSEEVDRREEILKYLQDWISQQQDFKLTLRMILTDMLVYGSAFCEIVYDEIDTEEKYSDEFTQYKIPDPHENYKMGENSVPYLQEVTISGNGSYVEARAKGNPVWLKPLDPLWMRVRRDSYGNDFGFLQFLSAPPVAFTPQKMLFVKYNPKSWWYENAYGVPMLLSLVRTQEAIWQLENDLIVISHACAKPPLLFSCGTDVDPWTEGQLLGFASETSSRGPGGDVYHRGDVKAIPLPFPASSLAPLLAHLDYHVEQRIVALGVPPQLLGMPEGSTRTTATVNLDDWISTIQQIQEQLSDAVEEQLFKYILEPVFGEGCPIPAMKWNEIFEKDEQAEVGKIISLKNSGIITLNESRAWLETIDKKLLPLRGGDTAEIPPEFVPVDSDDIPMEASFKAEEEYTVPDIEGYLYDPTKEEELVAKIVDDRQKELTEALASVDKELRKYSDNPRIKMIEEHDGVVFWLVSGNKVHDVYDEGWLHSEKPSKHSYIGGHHYVFSYIPNNEIWISDLNKQPKKTIIHEYVERCLMKDRKMSYSEAHMVAEMAEEKGFDEVDKFLHLYITPREVEERVSNSINWQKTDNIWRDEDGNKILFDKAKGEMLLYDNTGNLLNKTLIRSAEDIDIFLKKLR